jgi:hypothetical protein
MLPLSDLAVGEEPVVGEVYLVPCVDLSQTYIPEQISRSFREHQAKMVAIPVIGTVHTDAEFSGNAAGQHPHIHADVRFLSAWEIQNIWGSDFEAANSEGAAGFPVIPHKWGLVVPKPHLHPKMCERRIADHRRLSQGTSDEYDEFQDRMAKHTLNLEKPICPHHGTPLNGQPIRDGVITCPLHGATFCARTGRYVRKPLGEIQFWFPKVQCW